MIPDLESYTDADLDELQRAVYDETKRRNTIRDADIQLEQLQNKMLTALGRKRGKPWVKPEKTLQSFPKNWLVTHNGKSWVSKTAQNLEEPGTGTAWTEAKGQSPK